MKALELSRRYYFDCCEPVLRKEVPELLPRLAAGLVGEGSECFGWDDELSRDHDWGLRVCLFFPDAQLREHGTALLAAIDKFPREYEGFHLCPPVQGLKRGGLYGVGEFYAQTIGRPCAPETARQWLSVPEVSLAAAVNGEVFADPLGEFSAVRKKLLAGYPRDARLRMLALHAALAGQTGQYNMLRASRHGEALASKAAKFKFIEHAAAIFFLLRGRYRPFYKWLYRALRELPGGGSMHSLLLELAQSDDIRRECSLTESVSAALIAELRDGGLSDSGSDFLMDHVPELLGRIEDTELKGEPLSLL